MKSVLRSTAILGSSSLIAILIGLISSKAWALLLGPEGLGFMGLLQSLLGLSAIVIGMGIGTGLVRMGASALAQEDLDTVAALYKAAWYLFMGFGCIALILLTVFQTPIATWMLGGSQHRAYVPVMGIALLFTTATAIQASTLNAHHRVKALAAVSILNILIGTGINLLCIWVWREAGIAPGITAGACIHWLVSRYFLLKDPIISAHIYKNVSPQQVLTSAKHLLQFGGPYMFSSLVGTGIQLVIPILVLNILDEASVGFYRAAIAISVKYLGFLITALGQDYYPRVSAVNDQPALLHDTINQQFRLILLITMPLILGMLAGSRFIIPLVYSTEFIPAIQILEWQLIGDMFKFTSWTLAFVILSRGKSSTFFLTETVAGVTNLVATWLAIHWFGLAGLGISFLVTYVIYYICTFLIVRYSYGLNLERSNIVLFFISLSLLIVVKIFLYMLSGELALILSFIMSIAFGLYSFIYIWQNIRNSDVLVAE